MSEFRYYNDKQDKKSYARSGYFWQIILDSCKLISVSTSEYGLLYTNLFHTACTHPKFSMETPYFRWRPPDFYCFSQIFNGDPIFSLETPRFLLLFPNFQWRSHIFVGDPQIFIAFPKTSMEIPFFCWRPQIFIENPQIFNGDRIISLKTPIFSLQTPILEVPMKIWGCFCTDSRLFQHRNKAGLTRISGYVRIRISEYPPPLTNLFKFWTWFPCKAGFAN